MKADIHPPYTMATVTCACGSTFRVGSTKSEILTDVCSACHPFYTGQKKLVDSAGRVERFTRMLEKTSQKSTAKSAPKKQRKPKSRAAGARKLG